MSSGTPPRHSKLIEKKQAHGKVQFSMIDATVVRESLQKHGFRLNGITCSTIALDYQSLCGTVVFNADTLEVLRQYPGRTPCKTKYTKDNGKAFTINVATGLPALANMEEASTGLETIPFSVPLDILCCSLAVPLYNPRITNKAVFRQFLQKQGSSEFILRVCKKIQNGGPLEYIEYYQLKQSQLTPVEPTPYKTNSFMIYTCKEHNTYFSLNLNTKTNVRNAHHAKLQHETEFGSELEDILRNCICLSATSS